MAVNVVLNGVSYSIPEPGDTAWGQDLTDYFVAQASGLLQKAGGAFTLTGEVDFGGTFGLKSLYFKSRAAIPATTGQVRLGNADGISWRNAANDGNLRLEVNSSNELVYNNGVISQPVQGQITVTDTATIDLTLTGDDLSAIVKASSLTNTEISGTAAIAFSKMAALTAGRAPVSDGSGFLIASSVTATELSYLSGVTSALQTQLNSKQATGNYITALTGEVTAAGPGSAAATITNSAVIGKVLTGYVSGAGTVAATDTILQAIQKLNGNVAGFQPMATLTTKGDIYVATAAATVVRQGIGTNGQVLVADATQTNGLKWGNAPQGLKNYIVTNADIEQGATTGYGLGTVTLTSGFPSGVPTFGSGASGNLALAVVSSGQLAGTYSLSYASSAATTAGNFVATDPFTVDLEGQSKVMQIKVAYKAQANPTNGNFSGTASNSFGIAIYDVTNSAWIQPAGVFNLVQSSGVGIMTGTFQTSSSGTSYRLVFFNANASAGAITMYLDDFFVGPQITAAGAAVSDWTAYTPTFSAGFTGQSLQSGLWRRVGNSMEIQGSVSMTGSAAVLQTVSLPAGYSIDAAALTISNTSSNPGPKVGEYDGTATTANTNGSVVTATLTSTTLLYLGFSAQNTVSHLTPCNGNSVITSGSFTFSFTAKVPIAGWSSQTVMSNDTDTRVIAASATTATVSSGGANTPIVFGTSLFDTSAAYSTSTGRYTVPVSGIYDVGAYVYQSNHPGALSIYKNGVLYSKIGEAVTSTADGISPVSGSGKVQAVAGDILDVRLDIVLTVAGPGTISFSRLSGPATIAATESVSAKYTSSTTSFATNANTDVVMPTKEWDSHNAYNTTTGIYTVPVPGKYQVSGALFNLANTTATTAAARARIELYKNGVSAGFVAAFIFQQNSTAVTLCMNGSIDVSCNAGDALKLVVNNTSIVPTWSANGDNFSWTSFKRTGN